MSLEGKVALVTGSGRNLGRATVLEMARRGADVAINARSNRQEAESVAREAEALGVRAVALIADVGDEVQVNAMVEAALSELERIDVLVNNAGLRRATPIAEMSTDNWREVIAVNLDGPFYCSRAVTPGMIAQGGGRIINVSGLNAFQGRPGWAHVCASKMGAIGLTRALAQELAPHGILVNHIVPGAFDTTRTADQDVVSAAQVVPGIPVGRMGLPEELAKTCAFLASDDARYITGQTLHVNGGALAH
jgi:3-oxoacyl-[acyl-carrier protein] reductase